MTRRRVAVIAVLVVLMSGHAVSAIAGERYCGLASRYTLTTVTHYVGPSWSYPGYRLMQYRKRWQRVSSYYICRP